MQHTHTEYAYAKINPYLAVVGQRSDGYHNILSHMQAITLCDVLTFDWQDGQTDEFAVRLTCTEPSLACDDTNLVCRAAHALVDCLASHGRKTVGVLKIQLEKRIPMAAGLAGGSADAAATLRGLNLLLGGPFSMEELCRIGATLGADIPFCVQCVKSPSVKVMGIGDRMTPVRPLPSSVHLVIACYGEGVSTAWAYRRIDESGVTHMIEAEPGYNAYLAALDAGELAWMALYSYNSFEEIVCGERPAVSALMECMEKSQAVFARMSGSGPSAVGYFDDEAKARACANRLSAQGITAHVCRPLS